MNVDIPNLLRALRIDGRLVNGEIWACCPFPDHDEKEASWSIKWDGPNGQQNGLHRCFGCGRGGGPVRLVMEVVNLRIAENAVEWIKKRGLDLKDVAPMRARVVISDRVRPMKQPKGVRTGPLEGWVTPARRYALKRNLNPVQVDRWQLGYGVSGSYLARLYIPTHDAYGDLVNWTMREFHGDRSARYVNPEKNEGARLSSVFGERYWPDDVSDQLLILCEGELNALACERAGARYVAAMGGSQVDPKQLLRVGKFGRIVLATDVDRAGSKAAAVLKASLVRWRHVHRMKLPPKLDPCDIEDEDGIETLEQMLCHAAKQTGSGA